MNKEIITLDSMLRKVIFDLEMKRMKNPRIQFLNNKCCETFIDCLKSEYKCRCMNLNEATAKYKLERPIISLIKAQGGYYYYQYSTNEDLFIHYVQIRENEFIVKG